MLHQERAWVLAEMMSEPAFFPRSSRNSGDKFEFEMKMP